MKSIEKNKMATRMLELLLFFFLSISMAKGNTLLQEGLEISDDGTCLTFSSDKGFENWGSAGNYPNVTKIVIGKDVTEIPDHSFYSFPITEVTFSKNSTLETIGFSAFDKTKLKSIQIPASVKIIKQQAFSNCSKLESITFEENSNLTDIGLNAFFGQVSKLSKFPLL